MFGNERYVPIETISSKNRSKIYRANLRYFSILICLIFYFSKFDIVQEIWNTLMYFWYNNYFGKHAVDWTYAEVEWLNTKNDETRFIIFSFSIIFY